MTASPSRNEPREIDGVTYVASPLPATQALRILTRLTKMVGEAALVLAAKGREALDDLPADVLTYTVQTILGRLSEAEVEATIKELLASVYVHGADQSVAVTFNEHFRGRMAALFRVVQLALEVNYRDFFDALRSLPTSQLQGSE
jgi:hypothetical protein